MNAKAFVDFLLSEFAYPNTVDVTIEEAVDGKYSVSVQKFITKKEALALGKKLDEATAKETQKAY